MPVISGKLRDTILIGHIQAPTSTQTDESAIHPAGVGNTLLWHNGIIKEAQLSQWNSRDEWDTLCISKLIGEKGFDSLSRVDGSFACVYLNGELSMFRNDNCPMFIDGSSFSSTKFNNSTPIEPGVIYQYDNNEFIKTNILFETKETFYWSFD